MNWSQKVVDKLPFNLCQCSVKFDRRSLFMTHALFFAMLELKYQYITPVEVPICKFSESLV